MSRYLELKAQKEALDLQIETALAAERGAVLEEIRQLMSTYGITVANIAAPTSKKKAAGKSAVAAKYVDRASGKTWSGRGRMPLWLVGQDLDSFSV